jgi:hypothetical protein
MTKLLNVRNWESSIGTAIRLQAGWPENRRTIQDSGRFSVLHIVQTGSGVHLTSYKMGTGGSYPVVKRQAREADHSPQTNAEVKKMWIYISTPPYVFMA